jgi:hypothetical protein
VLKRHTPKADYDTSRLVSAQTLSVLLASVNDREVRAGGTVSEADLAPLRELCVKSSEVEFLTSRTVMETLHLLRVGPDEIVRHRDGLPINTWMARALSSLGLFDRSAPPQPGSQAFKAMMAQVEGNSRTAMGFVWLSGKNGRSDQVRAGRAYVRLQLKATEMGLGVHPLSQALQEFPEMASHYARVHQLTLKRQAPASPGDETLQMFCRLGYTDKPVPATPRRPLGAFVRT